MYIHGVAAVRAVRVGGCVVDMAVVEAVVPVVGAAFLGVGEHRVRGGDFCEAVAGGWVGAVAVWVVAEGEVVEFSRG
jgi:hypothetical protein